MTAVTNVLLQKKVELDEKEQTLAVIRRSNITYMCSNSPASSPPFPYASAASAPAASTDPHLAQSRARLTKFAQCRWPLATIPAFTVCKMFAWQRFGCQCQSAPDGTAATWSRRAMLSPTVLGFLGTPAHKSEVPVILVQNWLLWTFLKYTGTMLHMNAHVSAGLGPLSGTAIITSFVPLLRSAVLGKGGSGRAPVGLRRGERSRPR